MSESPSPAVRPNMFSQKSATSDAVLLVEGQEIHISKAILSVASSVFAAMFNLNFKEAFTQHIPLPGKKYDDLIEFLLCLYPNTMKSVDETNVNAVLPLADEYQVEHLKQKVENFFLFHFDQKSAPLEMLVHNLFLCDKYGLKKALEKAIGVVSMRRYSALVGINEFKSLKISVKFKIVSRRMVNLEDPALDVLLAANRLYEHGTGSVSDIESSYRKNSDKLNELLMYSK